MHEGLQTFVQIKLIKNSQTRDKTTTKSNSRPWWLGKARHIGALELPRVPSAGGKAKPCPQDMVPALPGAQHHGQR